MEELILKITDKEKKIVKDYIKGINFCGVFGDKLFRKISTMTPEQQKVRFREFKDFMLKRLHIQKDIVNNHKEEILKRQKQGITDKDKLLEIEKNFPKFIEKKKKQIAERIAIFEGV